MLNYEQTLNFFVACADIGLSLDKAEALYTKLCNAKLTDELSDIGDLAYLAMDECIDKSLLFGTASLSDLKLLIKSHTKICITNEQMHDILVQNGFVKSDDSKELLQFYCAPFANVILDFGRGYCYSASTNNGYLCSKGTSYIKLLAKLADL